MSVYEWLPCEECGRDVSVQYWMIEKTRGGRGLCDYCRDGRKGPAFVKRPAPEGWTLGEGGKKREKNPDENPETPASNEPENNPEKPAGNPGKKRPHVETWLYIWGEVEQQRLETGDLAGITISGALGPGSKGGYSLENSLLIHADIDRRLREMGSFAYDLASRAYVEGWRWEEATTTERWADGTTTLVRTGTYHRKAKKGALKHHEARTVADIARILARRMGLTWREDKKEEKNAA